MKRSKLRIMFVESGECGGSVRSLAGMVQGLGQNGCEIGLISHYRRTAPVDLLSLDCLERAHCLDAPPRVRPRPEVVRRTIGIPHLTTWALRFFHLSFRVFRAFRPDVVYLNEGPEINLPALVASRAIGIPTVCHRRCFRPLSRIERHCVAHIRRLVVLTETGRQYLRSQGVPPQKLRQIYNPICLDAFDRQSTRVLGLPFDEGSLNVIQVGKLKAHKRPDLAIEAFALARAECPNLRLVLAGDGPMRGQLETLIRSRGLDGSVFLLGHCDNIPALLRRCHISVLLSRSEGQPNCVMEYMAARLPVVTWNMAGIDELAEDGRTGFVAPKADPAAIARSLVRLCQSAELRRRMGVTGREKIAGDAFSPEGHFRRIHQMLQEVAFGRTGAKALAGGSSHRKSMETPLAAKPKGQG